MAKLDEVLRTGSKLRNRRRDVVVAFLTLIPASKHLHLVLSPITVFLKSPTLGHIPDLDFEKEQVAEFATKWFALAMPNRGADAQERIARLTRAYENSPSIRQLRQRIMFEHRLEGLAEHEVAAYVAHRLAVAGHARGPLLSASARRTLHRASRGLPRLINILMHKAMLLAYGEGAQALGRRHLSGAIADTPSASRPRPWWWLVPRVA